MKNKDKYKAHPKAFDAHTKWCKEKAKQGWMCTQECNLCYLDWLEMECEEKKDGNTK